MTTTDDQKAAIDPQEPQDGATPDPDGQGGDDATEPADGPVEAAEPFSHEVHAPTTAPGTEMPDLSGVTPVEPTPARDLGEGANPGHAGYGGAEGYGVSADEAGRDPSSDESQAAKGKRAK